MRITFCELPDRCDSAGQDAWDEFSRRVSDQDADLLLLNEMPFGAWLGASDTFDARRAQSSIDVHHQNLDRLGTLDVPAVLSSRPVWAGSRLANEAFLMRGGVYTPIHHKQYFPEEPGFHEAAWFQPGRPGFETVDYGALRVGVLLCTEVMFTEWARHYRRMGANVIAVPRASGASVHTWHAAAAMAAIVSGCYVVSSNRVSRERSCGFGGSGFAFSPTGHLLAQTSEACSEVTIELELKLVKAAQVAYPCYVRELGT